MFDEKFWLAIAFLSFVAILYKLIYPKLITNIDAKSKKIADDIVEAKKLRETAQKLLDEAQAFHKYSIEHAEKIINDAIIEAKKIEISSKNSLEEQTNKISSIAMQRIKSEEESAIRQVKNHLIDQAIKGIATQNFNDNEHKKIVEKSLSNINQFQQL